MKRIIPFLLVLALLLPLVSCREDARTEVESEIAAIREENIAKAESIGAQGAQGAHEGSGGTEGRTDGSPNAEPANNPSKKNRDGILSSEYQIVGNKFYFRTGRKNGVNIVTWYDVSTGGHDVICPDPLCKHDDPAVCRFIQVHEESDFIMADENTFIRSYRPNPNAKNDVYRFDLTSGETEKIYKVKQDAPDLIAVRDDVLWLVDYDTVTKNGRSAANRTLYGVGIHTGETVFEQELPLDCRVVCAAGDRLILDTVKTIVSASFDLTDRVTILEYANADRFGSWYYDTNTDEFWFGIVNQEKQTGTVYTLRSGVCTPVQLPAEEIYYFQLTDTKIYYSPYEPVYIGENPDLAYGLWDYSGGKIYEVKRNEPSSEANLIYDAKGEFFITRLGVSNYVILGDQLFFDNLSVVSRKDGVFFNAAGELPKVHIDLRTGELAYIRFE